MREFPAVFKSYTGRDGTTEIKCSLWQALRATTADLGTFTETIIHGKRYSGTSIANGNPTGHLTRELKKHYPGSKVQLILSLGSGHPATISLPRGTSTDVYDTLVALNKDCQGTHERMYTHWSQESRDPSGSGPYHRLNVEQGMQSMEGKSFDANIGGTVATHTTQYMQRHDVGKEIDRIVEILTNRMVQIDLELGTSDSSRLPDLPSVPTGIPVSPSYDALPRKHLLALGMLTWVDLKLNCRRSYLFFLQMVAV